jgi:uncharacterized membrane protein YsdA (DUF1294 family)
MYAGIFFIYLLAVNLAGLLIFHSDKKRAVKHRFRIPEARLFLIAILGGAAGCLLGMYLFRHKTRHARFVIGMPLLVILWIIIIIIVIVWNIRSGALGSAGPFFHAFFHNF